MFAYCYNNPVNMTDSEGSWPIFVIVSSLINHSINESIVDSIEVKSIVPKKGQEAELKNSYTAKEAVDAINKYLSDKGYADASARTTTKAFVIENSYTVTSRDDRFYISTIISRTKGVNREASNISAEWFGHNVFFFTKRGQTAELEKDGDTRWWVTLPTKALEELGWW